MVGLILAAFLAFSTALHPAGGAWSPPLPVNCAEHEFHFSDQITLASLGRLIFRWTGSAWERLPAPTDWDQLRVAGSGAIYLYSNATNTIYSSTDLGQSWTVVEVTIFAGMQSEELLYPSPVPGVLFMSPTDYEPSPPFLGIWKSTDNGRSWRPVYDLGGKLPWLAPIAFSPGFAQDGTAFAAVGGMGTFSGFLKSTDAGESWFVSVNDPPSAKAGPPVALVVSPQYPEDSTVFGGTGNQENGFYKTVNGGADWIYFPGAYFATPALALSPDYAADQTLLIAARPTLYLSTDGGVTQDEVWEVAGERAVVVGLRHEGAPGMPAGGDQGLEFWAVAQRGGPGAACYLYHSVDGGATWEQQWLFETPYNQHLPLVSR